MEKFQCVEIFHDKFLFFSDRISKIPRKSNTHDVLRSLRFTIYEMRKNSFSISLETNACQWGSWILDYHIFTNSHMHTSNSKSNKNAKCHLFGRAQCGYMCVNYSANDANSNDVWKYNGSAHTEIGRKPDYFIVTWRRKMHSESTTCTAKYCCASQCHQRKRFVCACVPTLIELFSFFTSTVLSLLENINKETFVQSHENAANESEMKRKVKYNHIQRRWVWRKSIEGDEIKIKTNEADVSAERVDFSRARLF